jgi:hypothetical protein
VHAYWVRVDSEENRNWLVKMKKILIVLKLQHSCLDRRFGAHESCLVVLGVRVRLGVAVVVVAVWVMGVIMGSNRRASEKYIVHMKRRRRMMEVMEVLVALKLRPVDLHVCSGHVDQVGYDPGNVHL